jgi:hypothetical protein
MRTRLIIVFFVIARALALCAETNALSFFVVSDTAIPGGRYIDTAEFPKLGYISNAPSYIVTRLRKVSTNDVTEVSLLRSGGKVDATTKITRGVSITLFPDDTKAFADFTRQNVFRRILLMLGDQPLTAPRVLAPIETGDVRLDSGTNDFSKRVIDGIQSLVRNEKAR